MSFCDQDSDSKHLGSLRLGLFWLARSSYEEKLADLKRQLEALRAAHGTGPALPNITGATTNHFGALMGHPHGMFGQGNPSSMPGSSNGNGTPLASNGASSSAAIPSDIKHDPLGTAGRNGHVPSASISTSASSSNRPHIPSMAMQLDERERERERQSAYEMTMEREHREREHREASASTAAGSKRARPLQDDVHMRDATSGFDGMASHGPPPSVKPRLGGLGEAGLESRTAGAAAFPPRPPSRTYAGSPHHQQPSYTAGRPSSAAAHHHPQSHAPEPSVLQQVPGDSKRSSIGDPQALAPQSHASSATPAPAPVPAHTGVTAPAHRQKREDWDVTYNKDLEKRLEVSLVHTFVHDSVVCCVRLSPDGKLLATGCNRNTTLYDTKTGQRIVQLIDPSVEKPDNYIRSVAFSPDGRTIATGSEDHMVRIWDIAFGKMKAVFGGHRQEIYSLAFTPDGTKVISGSGDRSAIIWNVETGKIDKQVFIEEPPRQSKQGEPHDAGVTSVAVSADGKYLVAGSLDHNVRIWEIATGRLLDKLKGHKDSVYSVAFIPGGRQILTGSLDKTLKIWEIGSLLTAVEKGETIDPSVSRCRPLQTLAGHKDFVLSVAATPDGQFVISGSKDRAVNFWSPKDDTTQFVLHGHKNSVISIAMSEVNGLLATGSGDWQARIFKIDGLGKAAVAPAAPTTAAVPPTLPSAAPVEQKAPGPASNGQSDGQNRPRSPTAPKQEDTSMTLPSVAPGTSVVPGTEKPPSTDGSTAVPASAQNASGSKSGSTASSTSGAAAAATSNAASTESAPAPAP